ncbi:hypothetical protein M3Y97_01146600 [Aphelenchoides bicaudatus]|nr:hypothetical protein M3Y97_01146600 [Aphelenchoides bicaudatus]
MDLDYAPIVQKLRIMQAASLAMTGLCLYSEADRIGLVAFLIPFSFVFAHIYVVAARWYLQIDGRYDFEEVFQSHSIEAKIHYAVQVFSPLVLGMLVHAFTPYIPSSLNATFFDLSHYLAIVAAFIVLALDSYGGLKKKFV